MGHPISNKSWKKPYGTRTISSPLLRMSCCKIEVVVKSQWHQRTKGGINSQPGLESVAMGSPTLMSSPFGRVVRDQQDARRKKRKLPETAEDRLRLKPVVVAIMLRGPGPFPMSQWMGHVVTLLSMLGRYPWIPCADVDDVVRWSFTVLRELSCV